MIKEKKLTNTRQVKKLIEDEFNVTYSERHISRIMDKLGFGYAKPYVIPAKSPEDADEQLKKNIKKANVSLKEDIIGFLDQSGIQNKNNNGRQYYDKNSSNRKKELGDRLKINGNGFQMVNGNSLVLCQPNTRIFQFIKSLIELRKINCNDVEIIKTLENILTNNDLSEEMIFEKLETRFEKLDVKNEFLNLIENTKSSSKNLLSKIKNKINSINPNKSENIENIQKNLIVEKLNETNITEKMQNEKRIILIADNYAVHRSKLIKQACIILNIEIVFLPPNSPHLNPIEQVWKSIKKYLAHFYLDDLEQMKQLFTNEFYRIVDNKTFYTNWLIKFLEYIPTDT